MFKPFLRISRTRSILRPENNYGICSLSLLSLKEGRTIHRSYQQDAATSHDERYGYEHSRFMNAWLSDRSSGLDNVNLSSTKIPPLLKPNEILIQVAASSVNPIDVAIINGYGSQVLDVMKTIDDICVANFDCNKYELPIAVGRDFVGKVVHRGQGVSDFFVGDHVWGTISPHKPGCHSEYVVAEACNVHAKPLSVNNIEAASIPYAALTAWSAAVVSGGMKPNNCHGMRALVIGASGGVGVMLTQLLNIWGAEVFGVCSEEAANLVQSCGALEVYDYKNPKTIVELTTFPNFDVIIDAGGSPDLRWAQGLKQHTNASYVSLSSPLLRNADTLGLIIGFSKSLCEILKQNSNYLSDGRLIKWAFYMPNPGALKEITKLVSEGKLKPVVQNVFGFENAIDAYRQVMTGPTRGKTVIDFIPSDKRSTANEGT